MLKQTLIAVAAVAIAAVPAFASWHHSSTSCGGDGSCGGSYDYTKTVTVTKAEVNNVATVDNYVFTGANSGLNEQSATGGDATSGGSTEHHWWGGSSGGTANAGDAKNVMFTGDAGASSTVTNVVNTTVVMQ